MLKRLCTSSYIIYVVAFCLFLVLLPLSLQINFWQNDDWNRTLTTLDFIHGKFILRQETANTFYLQGLLGLIFNLITGSEKFAVLTLIFSVLNFVVFTKIVDKFFVKSVVNSVIIGLFFFFNPFHIYSIWGYMAENYYLFFTLLSFYYFLCSQQEVILGEHNNLNAQNVRNLLTANVSAMLGFFIKQVSLLTMVCYIPYLFFQKRYKQLFIQLACFTFAVCYYYFLFPRTSEMHYKDLTLTHFLDFKHVFSLTWANLIYVSAFCIPMTILLVLSQVKYTFLTSGYTCIVKFFSGLKVNSSRLVLYLVLGISIYFLTKSFFNANIIGAGEFPYIQNTFTRFGFYTMNLRGTSYLFKGSYDLFTTWQFVATLFVYILIIFLATRKFSKINSPFLYFICGYLFLMLIITEMFDRYLLPVFPAFIIFSLFIIQKYKSVYNFIVVPFLLFLIFLNYQYSMDFVLSNKYMYDKTREIMRTENTLGELIAVNRAWRKVYPSSMPYPSVYVFSYNKPELDDVLGYMYKVVEIKKIDYPLNIHVNPNIYLYKYTGINPETYMRDFK